MKEKMPLIITIVVIIVAIIIAIIAFGGDKNKGDEGQNQEQVQEINIEESSKKITENSVFAEIATQDVTMEELESYFQINPENVEKVAGKIAMMNVHASMYVIIQAKDGKVEDVKSELNTFIEAYDQLWARYLPDQYDLVKNRQVGSVGNYIYLIIAENSEELKALIK